MSGVLNLARTPFVNRRPMLRLAGVLGLAALALTVVNIWNYWQHFAGRGQQRDELTQLTERTAEERAQLEQALTTLEGFDISWQTDQIEFLNAKIAERTFSWSDLFDDLSEVLPRSVRIERVTPKLGFSQSGRPGRVRGSLRHPGDEVFLDLTGAAEQDEALLELVDAFFDHDRFRRPDLQSESRIGDAGSVGFAMGVVYSPLPAVAAKESRVEAQVDKAQADKAQGDTAPGEGDPSDDAPVDEAGPQEAADKAQEGALAEEVQS